MTGATSIALKRLETDPLWTRAYAQSPRLDVGPGGDCLPDAEGYDQAQGNANYISNRPAGSYGLVYSSHCLEHLVFPLDALQRWWELVSPGGWLWVIVPDLVLYEGGMWPSKKNSEHKWMFSINRNVPNSRHLNALDFHRLITGGELMRLQLVDTGFDYTLSNDVDQSKTAEVGIEMVWRKA